MFMGVCVCMAPWAMHQLAHGGGGVASFLLLLSTYASWPFVTFLRLLRAPIFQMRKLRLIVYGMIINVQ